jgi:hypothetical protein
MAALRQKIAMSGLQSGSIMCVADILCQTGVEGKRIGADKKENRYDWHRTCRWAVAVRQYLTLLVFPMMLLQSEFSLEC